MDRRENKKTIILIGLCVIAVFVLIRGVVAPTKLRREAQQSPTSAADEARHIADTRVRTLRKHAKRSEYKSWGRNPFILSTVSGGAITEFRLNGIVWDEKNPQAIINGDIVGLGSRIDGNIVIDIKKDRVMLSDGTRNFELRLGE